MHTMHKTFSFVTAAILATACGSTAASSSGGTDDTTTEDTAATGSDTATGTDATAGQDTTVADTGGSGQCVLTTDLSNALNFGALEIGNYSPNFLKGLAVEAVPCGSVATNENAEGRLYPAHPGTPFYYKLTKDAYLPALSMEYQVAINQGGTFGQNKSMVVVPTAAAEATLPGYDATKASVLLRIDMGTPACKAAGFTVTVDGHAEAKITYWSNVPESSGKADKTLTSVPKNSDGMVSITGLTPGALAPFKVTVTGATGCVLTTDGLMPGRTGNVPLEAGSVTLVDVRG